MKLTSLFFLAFLLCFPAWGQYTLQGSVKDKESNEPLSFVVVELQGTFQKMYTDASGKFAFKGLKAGTYTLASVSAGYKSFSLNIVLNGDQETAVLLEPEVIMMEDAVVNATAAPEYAPVSQTKITKEQIENQNLGKDLPYLLESVPNLVTYSDAGAGVGYTGMRIRGSDLTRINVTINGIPVNDAESQGVYWVDIPDIASSVSSISVQRGVGTSTNGSGAFGATVNVETNQLTPDAFGRISSTVGMFNTFKNTIEVNSGLIGKHFIMNGRLSKVTSNGYIDRGWSDLKSFFLSGGYFGKKTILKFNIFSGKESTYQSWNGVPEDSLEVHRTFNSCGTDGGLKSIPYKNETDNYQQDYYQLFFTQYLGKYFNLNLAGHYTRGKGYYEQYKVNQYLPDYGITPSVVNSDTLYNSDLVRRLWLDNHYFGGTWNVNYTRKLLQLTLGGGVHHYIGKHYGQVIWAQHTGDSETEHTYYNRDANKTDINVYAKAEVIAFKGFKIFGDLQYRFVNYNIMGFPSNGNIIVKNNYHFFNPKIGISYDLNSKNNFYAYFGISNKEPNRVDFEAPASQQPKHETLNDLEFGYIRKGSIYRISVNGYYMNYKNQLVQTGKINDVGAYTRTNAASSYRLGIEIEGSVNIFKSLTLTANVNASLNKIRDFTEYIDNYDTGIQEEIHYTNTDISFSPPVTAYLGIRYEPVKRLLLNLSVKYVDIQFLDNTSNRSRKLDRYAVGDIVINYDIPVKNICSVGFNLGVYNFFNTMYEPNGYTFSYIYGGSQTTENFYYPQAGTHIMGGIEIRLGKINP